MCRALAWFGAGGWPVLRKSSGRIEPNTVFSNIDTVNCKITESLRFRRRPIASFCQRQSKSGPKGSAKCCHSGVGIISAASVEEQQIYSDLASGKKDECALFTAKKTLAAFEPNFGPHVWREAMGLISAHLDGVRALFWPLSQFKSPLACCDTRYLVLGSSRMSWYTK